MSHLRPDLKANELLYQSVTIESLSMASAITPIAQPAWRWSWRAILACLRAWQANRQARRDLAMLDARALRDLGIAPDHVRYELGRPFWRAPCDPRF